MHLREAIFISDVHESYQDEFFWEFLLFLENSSIKQVFFMGDIFDFLVGEIENTCFLAKRYIDKINQIALNKEVHYFEGNHDFNLAKLFKNVKVYTFLQQPSIFSFHDKKVLMLHGDKFADFSYQIYTKIIRNKTLLYMLNKIDKISNYSISNLILKLLSKKDICKKFADFEKTSYLRIKNDYNYKNLDFIIEGHFHQGRNFKINHVNYINLSSFKCEKTYLQIKNDKIEFKKVKNDKIMCV